MVIRTGRRQFVTSAAAGLAALLTAGQIAPADAAPTPAPAPLARVASPPDAATPIETAWERAGFWIEYGEDLCRPHVYGFATIDQAVAIALLPARVETAAPAERAAILTDLHAELERGRECFSPFGACADRLRAALAAPDA